MSPIEMYRKLIDNYVTNCWLTMNTVDEVRNAIDKFMANMPVEFQGRTVNAIKTGYNMRNSL